MTQEVKEWFDMSAVDLGVAARYPNELFLEERHSKEALQFAHEIFQWVKEIVE